MNFTFLELILLIIVLLAVGALIGHHFASFSFGNALTRFSNTMRSDLHDAEMAIKSHVSGGITDVKREVAAVKADVAGVAVHAEAAADHAESVTKQLATTIAAKV